ncbi:hypothetical protein F5884DRAFT_778187 [Xylogone sp. PMI_703]|nr:hypothetical protein F5884DRAFT_778187 [Xylogone sp. PMI_703]
MITPTPLQAIGAVAATAAAVVYTDAKLGFSVDRRYKKQEKLFEKLFPQHLKKLGDHPTLYHMLEIADPNADALWFEGKTWTYRQMLEEVNSLVQHLTSLPVPIKAGNIVVVMTTNSPEMVWTIYALSAIGAYPSLVNTSLKGAVLKHCVDVVKSGFAICTPDLEPALVEALSDPTTPIERPINHITINVGSFLGPRTYESIPNAPNYPSPPATLASMAFLIYTSGTTGKPKAVSLKALRVALTSCPIAPDVENPKKYFPLRIYTCMPLFHGTSIFAGLCSAVGVSGTLCTARKFSASRFWSDIHHSRATRILYVGELLRYLINTPPGPFDTNHNCIVAFGNGLQKEVWEKFRSRFGVPEIREIYRATEGLSKYDNISFNSWGAGCVGFVGPITRFVEKDTFIVKYDHDQEDIYRDPKTGRCVVAARNEPGEIIGRVPSMAGYPDYYLNPAATNAKLIKDVFEPGDLWQRSGDLAVVDKEGWVHFRDRIGDTYRWKGENVSSQEIRLIIAELEEIIDVVVFGSKLPKYDGQAGAAAIKLKARNPATEEKVMQELYAHLVEKGVPSYAIPRLVRITDDMETTATFKHVKHVMKNRSWYDKEAKYTDTVYWLDDKVYRKLEEHHWRDIERGDAKL